MKQQNPSTTGQLLGLLFLSIFALAFAGLFGVWYSHEKSGSALREVGDLSQLNNTSRQAQVKFKIQVQLWKNILLRGRDPGDLKSYSDRFVAMRNEVNENLNSIADSTVLPKSLLPEMKAVLQDHQKLDQLYDAALAKYDPTNPEAPFEADRSVRGIDQSLNQQIDALAEALIQMETQRVADLQNELEKIYHNLQLAVGISAAVAVACASLLAWRSRSQTT